MVNVPFTSRIDKFAAVGGDQPQNEEATFAEESVPDEHLVLEEDTGSLTADFEIRDEDGDEADGDLAEPVSPAGSERQGHDHQAAPLLVEVDDASGAPLMELLQEQPAPLSLVDDFSKDVKVSHPKSLKPIRLTCFILR